MPNLLDRLRTALAGRYEIQRELGRGGMATVYLAQDLKHHRPVALKVLNPELAALLGSNRFLREIEIAAKLTHPHILPLYDSGQAGESAGDAGAGSPSAQPHDRSAAGFLYYVMPYVEGESLRDRLIREKQLPVDDALRISREVADALSYAHGRGVIHRDIKPENILLQSGHAVVADFGIARAIDQAGGEDLTATGIGLGTPAYMSPEQAGGSRNLDGRSDLYSLGCVLYEMLAGRPPFAGPTVESVVHQHLSAEPPNITGIRPAVPAYVAAALERALSKTPADRFNPVALFAEALGPRASADGTAAPARRRLSGGRIALLGVGAVVLIAGAVALGRWTRTGSGGPSPAAEHQRTAIAVLPFRNLSAEGPYAYFAGGLHDELLTQLAKVRTLKVISRTSVMEYATRTRSLREIADDLDVGTVVEGSVQVLGERLRVNVQLIDAATDEHVWAERYDRTLDDAFAIQSDLARQVVAAVGAALGAGEQQALSRAPTANPEAYRLYLQGEEYRRRPEELRPDLETAQRLYEEALALDPDFALAHASLSLVHGLLHWARYDPFPDRIERQEAAARTALRLAPDLPQAHLAMGLAHYWGRRDYRRALEELTEAASGLPGDAGVWEYIAAVHRRLGNWSELIAALERATALDPRDVRLVYDLGGLTYLLLHRFAEAASAFDRAAALAPDLDAARVMKGWTYVWWTGLTDTLRAALGEAPTATGALGAELGDALAQTAELELLDRNAPALRRLLSDPRQVVADMQGRPYLPRFLYLAWAHDLEGDTAAARLAYQAARDTLESAVRSLPGDWRMHAGLGLALAGLGGRDGARREADWLRESVEYRQDALLRVSLAEARAMILAQVGDVEPTIQELEPLLRGPSYTSGQSVRIDPRWDRIRGDPRFQALLRKYQNQ